MSPIILKHSHSHSFGYTDKDGIGREVTVIRGQDIEPLDIPIARLTKLMSEYVVSFDGTSRRPRYEYVETETEQEAGTYTSGVVTAQLAARQMKKADPSEEKPDFAALQAAAERAEAAQAAMDLDMKERAEADAAAREQAEAEAAEQAERAAAAEAKLVELEASLREKEKADKAAADAPKTNTPTPRAAKGGKANK